MKTVVAVVSGALLLTLALAAPAAAQPYWQSDLTCDLDNSGTFGDEGAARPFATIKYATGDLYVSAVRGLPANTAFDCWVFCPFNVPAAHNRQRCATSDINGTLGPVILDGFATQAKLGLTPSNPVCLGIDFFLTDSVGTVYCVEGFRPRF